MNVKYSLWLRKKRKQAINRWYRLMEPLADYLDKREEHKNKEIYEKVGFRYATRVTAIATARHLIKHKVNRSFPYRFPIADHWDNDYFNYDAPFDDIDFKIDNIKGKRKKIAWDKYHNHPLFLGEVLFILNATSGIVVRREIEDFSRTFYEPWDYQETIKVYLEPDKSKEKQAEEGYMKRTDRDIEYRNKEYQSRK